MNKLSLLVVLACLALALAEPRTPQHGVIHQIQKGVAGPNPYIFLTVPKGRSQAVVQGFEVIEEDDNKKSASAQDNDNEEDDEEVNDKEDMAQNEDKDEDDADDADDDEEEDLSLDDDVDNDDEDDLKNLLNDIEEDDDEEVDELDNVMSKNLKLRRSRPQIKNAKATQMMVSREHAGAILVPDEVVEIEGQSVIDEKTGKPALLLPRSVLDSIPDGSVVALMERTVEDQSEERANRVIVRRRRKGARRNIKRRRGGNKRRRVNRRGGNKRRRNNRRKNVRVVRRRNKNGRRGNKRRVNRRRVSYQF